MKKTAKRTLALLAALILALCCALTPAVSAESTAADWDASISSRDTSGAYDAASAVTLSPEDELTVTEEGVYILTGDYVNKMLVVDAGEEAKVQLVLDNAVLTNENGPAIYVRSADKVFLTAAEGTVNEISDGADYTLTDGETTLDAAVFSREDLTVNGAGKLTVNGNCKHAIVSKDDLVVTAADLTVNAVNVGLSGKDSVRLAGAAVSVTAGTDGVRADNAADASRGFVSVTDSVLSVSAGGDGIQAETAFLAENAEISVTAGSAANSGDGSCKGIKAGVYVSLDGGSCRIEALDDAVHTGGTLTVSAGELTVESGDDGLRADAAAEITGGTLDITAREGVEATHVFIRGGEITVQASDDGINAARKSGADTPSVEISGGTLRITMSAGDTDGIDSNGSLAISGGTVYVDGQSPFDYDGSASFTGGTVYVNGEQVSELQNQLMGGFGGFGGFGGMTPPEGDGNFPGAGDGNFPGGFGGMGRPGGQGGFPGGHGGRP